MDKQNLIIFEIVSLYEIIKELEENLNFNIFRAINKKNLDDQLRNLKNYLIVTEKKLDCKYNQFIFF